MAGKVSKYNVWSIDETGILTIKVEGNTQSLTSTKDGSIGDGRIPAAEVDHDIGEELDAFELML